MKRNVVKQGPSTLMVSLPSKWAKKYNIQKGDQLDLTEAGRSLTIQTETQEKPKSKTIKLLHSQYVYTWTELMAAYISGYDEIRVENLKQESTEYITTMGLRFLKGFDIIEQTSNHITLKKILTENTQEFNTIIRRIFICLLEISKIFQNHLETDKGIEKLVPIVYTNDASCQYLKRLLTKEGFEKPEKTTFAAILVDILEKISKHFKYVTWSIEKYNVKNTPQEIIEHYKLAHKKLEMVYELYFNYSHELYEQIQNNSVKVSSKTGDTLDLFHLEPHVMRYISSIIDKLRLASYEIHGINS